MKYNSIIQQNYKGSNLKYKSKSEAMSIENLEIYKEDRNKKTLKLKNLERLKKANLIDNNGRW